MSSTLITTPFGFGQPRYIDIVRTGGLEREPNEFTAALDGGPVMELVGHTEMVAWVQRFAKSQAARKK